MRGGRGWSDGPLGAQPAGGEAVGGRGQQGAPLLQRGLGEKNAAPERQREAAAVLINRHPRWDDGHHVVRV